MCIAQDMNPVPCSNYYRYYPVQISGGGVTHRTQFVTNMKAVRKQHTLTLVIPMCIWINNRESNSV